MKTEIHISQRFIAIAKLKLITSFNLKITGATGTFQTPDGKTVTVTNGIITSIQ
jgi:hypothetical protein